MAVTIKDLRYSIYLNSADAKKSAIDMQNQIQKLGDEIQKLSDEGKLTDAVLKEKKKTYNDLTAALAENKKESGLLSYSWNELSKLSRTMKADMNRMIPDSSEWKQLDKDIKAVDARMLELRGTANDTQNGLNKMATGVGGFINSAKNGDLVGMIPMLGKFAGVIGLVSAGIGFAKSVMESTRGTSVEFKADIEGISTAWDYLLKSVAGGGLSFQGMIDAFNAGRQYKLTLGEIVKEQQSLNVEEAKNFNKKQELLEIQRNSNLSIAERKKAGDQILQITQDEENKKQKIANESYNNQMRRITALTGMSKNAYESFMESYNNKDFQAISKSALAYNKYKSDTEKIFNTLITSGGSYAMAQASRYKNTLDNLEKNTDSSTKKLANFYKQYNKTTADDVNGLVSLQVNAIKVHGEAIQETQRIRRTNHTLEKQMTEEEVNKHKEAAKEELRILTEQSESRKKIIADSNIQMEVETAAYNTRLKKEGLFEVDATNLTAEQLEKREKIQLEYQTNLTKIAINAENKRFAQTKKDNGVNVGKNAKGEDKTPEESGLSGEKLKAYELIYQQHEINLTNIADSGTKKRTDAEKQMDADIITVMNNATTAELSSLETVQSTKTHNLATDYNTHSNGITSEKIYLDKLAQLDVDYLKDKLAAETKHRDLLEAMNLPKTAANIKAMQDADKAVAATQAQIDAKEVKQTEETENTKNKIKSKYDKDTLAEQYKIEKAAIDAKYAGENKNEEDHQKELFQLKIKYAVKYAQESNQVVQAASSFVSALDQAQTDNLETEKQKQLTLAGNNASARAKIETEFAQKELDLKKKQADADMAIKIAQALAAGALGIANIWAIDGINPILAGVLTGIEVATVGLQISSIIAQRSAIQNTTIPTSTYSSGGFTSSASDDTTPAGTVHANEFVASAKAVRNPHVKKYLDVFNAAQMNGTIHLLNSTQILEKVRAQTSTGYQGGGYVQTPTGSAGTISNDVAIAIISENAKQMKRLNNHLDKGIPAYSIISGDYGTVKQTARYQKMVANATRKG